MTGCTPSLLEVIGNYYELMGFEVEDISIDMYGKDCEVILTTDMSKEEIDKTMKKEDMFHAIYYEKKNMNYQVTKIKINDVTYEE